MHKHPPLIDCQLGHAQGYQFATVYCWCAGLQKIAESLHLRAQPSKVQQLLAYVPEPLKHKGRDISAQIDFQLQDYAPWQIVLATALAVLLSVQLLKWATAASEDIRERGAHNISWTEAFYPSHRFPPFCLRQIDDSSAVQASFRQHATLESLCQSSVASCRRGRHKLSYASQLLSCVVRNN